LEGGGEAGTVSRSNCQAGACTSGRSVVTVCSIRPIADARNLRINRLNRPSGTTPELVTRIVAGTVEALS